jgi:hypothetical protein
MAERLTEAQRRDLRCLPAYTCDISGRTMRALERTGLVQLSPGRWPDPRVWSLTAAGQAALAGRAEREE